MNTPQPTPKPPEQPPRRRRSRIWRILKWTLLVLLLVIVVIVGLVVWVAGTQTGTEFAWHRIKGHLPASIQIDSLHGRLIGPLHITGVDYQTDAMTAHVGSIDFNMDFSAIWHGTVHIKHLDVADVDYKVLKKTPAKPKKKQGSFSLPKKIKLPVAVVVDRISVKNVTAVTAPGAKPFQVDDLKLVDARLDNARWRIKSLTGHGPMFDLDAHGEVTPKNDYPTALHATAKLRLPNYAPIDTRAEISGRLDDLHLEAAIASPYNLKLSGRVLDPLQKPSLQAEITATDVHAQAISKSLPKLTANADIHADGPADDLSLKLGADVDSADYGRATLAGNVHYTPSRVTINNLQVATPATKGRLTANGQLGLGADKQMDLTVDWANLAWPLATKPAYKSDQGKIRLTGTLNDYNLTTNLVWQVVGQTQGKLAAKGSGSRKAFNLQSLDISGGPGHITGQAQTRWAPQLDVAAQLQGRHINPGAIVAGMAGDFDLDADVTASRKNQVLQARIKKLTAHGSLRHQPLDLEAKLQYLGNQVKISTLHLVSGATTVDIAGQLGWTPDAKLDAHWAIHSKDLSTLLPDMAGSLQSQGQVSGRFKAPNVQASLAARDVKAFGNKVARADLDARVDWSGATHSNVDLKVADIEAAGRKIDRVNLNLEGTPADHRLTLVLDSALAKANLALTGAYNKSDQRERFKLRKLKAAYQDLPPWSLTSPATGQVSAKAQSLADACLTSGRARLCLDASHASTGSQAHIALSNFNYSYAQKFFPEGMKATGSISGTVDAKVPAGGAPQAKVDFKTTAAHVSMINPVGKQVSVLDMRPGHIQARLANNGLDADVQLPLRGSEGVSAKVSVASGSGSLLQHALSGQVHIGVESLDFITRLSPEIATFDGRFAGDIRLGGTPAKPSVLGNIGLKANKIVLVTPGLTVTDVNLSAQGNGDSIAIRARAESGGGTLRANGKVDLHKHGQTVDLAIKGDHFQMVHIPDVTAYVSPDLRIAVAPSKIDVSGSVTIPEASVTPRNLPKSGVTTVSSDQVIVTEKQNKTQAVARAVNVDVNVIFGDKVHVEGFGLKADLQGNLRIVQKPGSEPTGTGAINIVNGSYRAYGQNLDIQKGQILFAGGPVSQPGLDFKAARYPNKQVTVGVHVSGSLKHPKLTLFSSPPMSQNEQLSWLLLGRPLDSTNGQQSSMIAQAALALGSSRANKVLQGIGSKLGLDTVGIGSNAGAGEEGETSLTVGKYLSPNLYIGYGLGLFDRVSTVTMRYTLSSHWTLQTESSSKGSGGDVIWHFDRK